MNAYKVPLCSAQTVTDPDFGAGLTMNAVGEGGMVKLFLGKMAVRRLAEMAGWKVRESKPTQYEVR